VIPYRPDLLAGCRVAAVGAAGMPVHPRLQALGAQIEHLPADTLSNEDAAAAWARDLSPLDALLFDAADSFGDGGAGSLRLALERAWRAARAVATEAMIGPARAGRLVFVAPAPDAGPYADAARAALENLARTLSVEWARFTITAVAITPGPRATVEETADLVCFLLSPAGGYFSGARFELGAAQAPA
jgi:NAD(P)-dependent dehydrogenase (short-subunit alcohol dehydrogenase family)